MHPDVRRLSPPKEFGKQIGKERMNVKTYADVSLKVREMVSYILGDQVNLSYPMPDITHAIRVERYFLYPAGNTLTRSRPFGILTVEMESGQLLSFQDCRIKDFMETEKHPFDQNISYELPRRIGTKQFKVEQSLINKLYESVRGFAFEEKLTDEQKELLSKYWVLLLRSVPSSLQPYYQKMGKNFYRWGYLHVQ